jgi:RecQ family ATP-dependent DNA helicase
MAEDAQARLALQGLEGIAEAAPEIALTRAYSGPREPEALLAHLGYGAFRTGQREAVAAALDGRDSLIVMPTGGGKSLCYQLPGLASEDLTLVVSPLIALMSDQWRRLVDGGHPAVMLASGLPDERMRTAFSQIRDGTARIAYCSPERFASGAFLEALGRRRVDLFAIDEAHCISEWGHDFRPDYLRLLEAIERLGRPTVMACTATATPQVSREIVARLGLREPLLVRSGFDRPNLSFDIVALEGKGSKARKLALLERGLAGPANRPAIVYCGTRRDTDEVADELRRAGLLAVGYHAGMEADERASAQHRFMTGDAEVVVATNAFGMGIDKANVRSVWHWAIPTSVEAYYQEAGRAGRDGAPARAVLLAMRSDLGRLVRFNQQRAAEQQAIARQRGWQAYRAVEAFSFGGGCRRRALLDHFGDPAPGAASGRCCDVCDPPSWLPDPSRIVIRKTSRAGRGAAAGKRAPAPVPDAGDVDQALFEALKVWRREAAGDKPAYTVAHDATLATIAAARPTDPESLAEIRGVGPAFLARHADAVLSLVAGEG